MSVTKRRMEEKTGKSWKVNPDEVRIARRNQLGETLDSVANALLVAIYESIDPVVQLTLKVKDTGSWLVIVKRDTALGPEVMFSGGEDFLEAIIRCSEKINTGNWKPEEAWSPKSG